MGLSDGVTGEAHWGPYGQSRGKVVLDARTTLDDEKGPHLVRK